MKRLLCMILTGLMLLFAACTAAPNTPNAEVPTDPPANDPTPEPTDDASIELPVEPITTLPLDPPDELPPDPTLPQPQGSDGEQASGIDTEGQTEPSGQTSDTNFALALAAKLLDGKQNRNLSPISVYLAMAMVAEGANGDTLAELLNVLGCESLEELRGVCAALLEALTVDAGENSQLDIHNSLWMAQEIDGTPVTFREDYLKVLTSSYRSEANTVQFGTLSAGKQIADWINEQTRGKIRVQPMQFDPSTLAVLINTIYLKDGWSEVFAPEDTEEDLFDGINADTGESQKINADFMRRFDKNVVLVQGDGWLRYSVRLNRVGSMVFVLPDEGIDLETLLGSSEAIEKLLYAGINKTCNVSLRIPKFEFQDKMALEEILASMGLDLSFTPAADFSGMSDTPCRIDSVLQESYIGVDENGVEAAAYTMVSMRTTAFFNPVELETIDFHLTRPFLFAIESYDGTLLFVGTVTAPSEHEVPHN